MGDQERKEFDHMLNAPTTADVQAMAKQMVAESQAPDKQAPTWWTED